MINTNMIMVDLEDKIALVSGATRGAGRGIACALGEAFATVYCTGRSSKMQKSESLETIEETAELVSKLGGKGIAVRVDHQIEQEIKSLILQIEKESGKLDFLVNDIWGAGSLTEMSKPFWELSIDNGKKMFDQALFSHISTSKYAVPLMQKTGGVIIEVTDGDNFGYRGELSYDLIKMSVIRLAFIMAYELRKHKIYSIAVTPGYLRSEEMLRSFKVTEENWRDGIKKDPNWIASETPLFLGRAVACLLNDQDLAKKNGRVFSSWNLAKEYGFTDRDGTQPDWGKHFLKTYGRMYQEATEEAYKFWQNGAIEIAFPNWPLASFQTRPPQF
jgi:NAD(P)-dependent dehydrogenase (short-subunit alcohol dehydrogenase family)